MSSSTGESASAADLAALRTQVTPENVMLLHHGLLAEAQYMREQINIHLQWRVGAPGRDPVSPQAARAFNTKIDNLQEQLLGYVAALHTMAEEMAATAERYGHAEAQIQSSFAQFKERYEHERGGS